MYNRWKIRIKNGVQIWDGTEIKDDVFIGPNVSFCNDKYPISKIKRKDYGKIIISKGASIGAGAIILPGVKIGEDVLIGAGTLLSKNIPDGMQAYGNPLKVKRR